MQSHGKNDYHQWLSDGSRVSRIRFPPQTTLGEFTALLGPYSPNGCTLATQLRLFNWLHICNVFISWSLTFQLSNFQLRG